MDGKRSINHLQGGTRRHFPDPIYLLLSLIITCAWVTPVQAGEPPSNQALVLLSPGADASAIEEVIHLAGGQVTHVFPAAALIGQMPVDMPPPPGVLSVHRQALDAAIMATLTGPTRQAAQVWNALLAPPVSSDPVYGMESLEAELVGDAMIAPTDEGIQPFSDGLIPGYYQTSEFFIGRVAVGIVLPESDGSLDPSAENWTEAERGLVLSEITAALNWWAAREPKAHLTFVYDDGTGAPITTGYEPISRRYSDQSLWIAEVMGRKGYTGSSYFDQVRRYNNALRDAYDTDWAFTIFVVDSSNDGDNHFSDGYFAYAYLGGPFTVMTSGNNGYGPNNLDAVAAHEIGHVFLALDQYYSAYQPCTRRSGYLGVENQNSQYGACTSNVTSVMRGQTWPYSAGAIDVYARAQLGWRDADADGILDPVDTTLSIVGADYVIDAVQPNVLTFYGSVQDDPYPSPMRISTIINTIEQVQYRVQGGEWQDIQPADGAFDTYVEAFNFTTPPLPSGDLAVDLRVIDSAGNELIQTMDTVSVVDPVDAVLDTTLTCLGKAGGEGEATQIMYSGQGISSASTIAGVYYRIDAQPWQILVPEDGAFDESQEGFSLVVDLTALSPGVHQVQAYSADAEGHVETSPASESLLVQADTHSIFLPLIIAGR